MDTNRLPCGGMAFWVADGSRKTADRICGRNVKWIGKEIPFFPCSADKLTSLGENSRISYR